MISHIFVESNYLITSPPYHQSTGYWALYIAMDTSIDARKYSTSAMTKERFPITQYNMYNKVEFLGAWRQLVKFYGCEDNLNHERMPEGYNVESWRRGRSTAEVLLQSHLIDSVYQNITKTSGDSPYSKWRSSRRCSCLARTLKC